MARRKYQFPDRATAEEAYKKANVKELQQVRLARALYTNTVDWCQQRGAYRFGIFDKHSPGGPKVVKVFHPQCNQEPDLQVIDPYSDELRELEEMAIRFNDDETQDILDGINEVRTSLAAL